MAPASPLKAPCQRGFTLVELVTAIILVGVLSALVLPRFVGTGQFSRLAAVDQALSGVRHAQQQAMSRGRLVRFVYGGSQYGVEVRDPATGTYSDVANRSPWQLPGGTSFSGSGQLTFDGKGALVGAGSCPQTLSVGGGSITVRCETGFASGG